MSVKIKICGIKDLEDAFVCIEEGANALGFIFYRKSPRFILPKVAKKIVKQLPPFVSRVGVFVDERPAYVKEISQFVGLDTLQFHGKESASFCRNFQNKFKVIKSFFPTVKDVTSLIGRFDVDGVLLDIPFEEKKKNPKAHLDSRLIKKISSQIKFLILSGGLTIANVANVVKRFKPYAVDVARGVEKIPGKKDRDLVKKFIRTVRRADV